jgi:hypothetical protein
VARTGQPTADEGRHPEALQALRAQVSCKVALIFLAFINFLLTPQLIILPCCCCCSDQTVTENRINLTFRLVNHRSG